jgi:hypothetical protein
VPRLASAALAVAAVASLALAGCSSGAKVGGGPIPGATASPAPPTEAATASATPAGSPLPSPSLTAAHLYAERCAGAQLRLALGTPVSEATGQRTVALTLTNTSQRACHLFGYPGISFVDASHRVLPFQYVHSGDQMITATPPVWVGLPPGAVAYASVNNYRCDMGDTMTAATVRLIAPDDTATLALSLDGARSVSWCGAGDPGSTVAVSPVEPALPDTLWAHR